MPSKRPQVVLVSRLFVLRDHSKKPLLIIRRAQDDSHHPGLWECPGGKLDAGQDLFHAQEREVLEETGYLVQPVHPLVSLESYVIGNGPYKGLPYVAVFGIAKCIGGKLQLSEEHDDSAWVSYEEMLEYNLTPEVHKAAIVLRKHF